MTITAVTSPIEPADRGPSKPKAAHDFDEKSGSFLDTLKLFSADGEVSKSATNGAFQIPQDLGIPAISEQVQTGLPPSGIVPQLETADLASHESPEQAQLPEIPNFIAPVDGSIEIPAAPNDTTTSENIDNPEIADPILSADNEKDIAIDEDASAQGDEINIAEILLPLPIIMAPIQLSNVQSDMGQDAEGTEGKEAIQTPLESLTTLKAFPPITSNMKSDDETLSGSDGGKPDSESDYAQASDTDSFTSLLAKSSDLSDAEHAVDEIRKNIGAPQDQSQFASTSGRPTSINDLPLEIGMRMLEGAREIKIVLSPESLGEISIKLDIAPDSSISANFTTDNPATLALLMQDGAALKKSLEQTSISSSSATLQFSLSRDGQQNSNPHDRNPQGHEQKPVWSEPPYTRPSADMPDTSKNYYSIQRLDRTI